MKRPNKAETEFISAIPAESTDDEDSVFTRLGASLAEIRKMEGVQGYILRSNSSAMIDLAELDKISQYAALSYQLHESSVEIAKELNIAEFERAIVEGKTLNVLFVKIGENKVSIFIEKNASHSGIIKQVLA